MPSLLAQPNGEVTVVTFTDSKILDEYKINQLNEEMQKLAEKNAGGKMLMNFGDVQFMSSAVLGKLVMINKKCKADKTDLKFCNIHPEIMKVFTITKLHKVFDIHDTEEKALSAFNKRGWFG